MKQEIPHSVFVEVSDIEMREKNVMWIRAFLIAERESQKGMLVGKGGAQGQADPAERPERTGQNLHPEDPS
jgi:GTPase Era involved in 16S rRNA processing